jgi:arginine decarboxylase
MSKIMNSAPRIDHFFSAVAARVDCWRDLNRAAQTWAASPAGGAAGLQAACADALAELLPMEDFQAYPGSRLLNAIKDRLAGGDALGTARLVQRVSSGLMSRSYRSDAGEWETEDDAPGAERVMPTAMGEAAAKPYFEVLFVTPSPPSRWPTHVQQIRKLRRAQDEFVYEPVFVGTFEDAALGVILNTNLEAVVIYDGFPYPSSHDIPLLRSFLSSRLAINAEDRAPKDYGLKLAEIVKRFRPELDVYLLADKKPDAIISDPAAAGLRRVFYEVEEPLEIHLSILAGVAERYETPFFVSVGGGWAATFEDVRKEMAATPMYAGSSLEMRVPMVFSSGMTGMLLTEVCVSADSVRPIDPSKASMDLGKVRPGNQYSIPVYMKFDSDTGDHIFMYERFVELPACK